MDYIVYERFFHRCDHERSTEEHSAAEIEKLNIEKKDRNKIKESTSKPSPIFFE